jgi:plasmid stability protein
MASILIRNLPERTKDRLRQRAAKHRRSLEAELRAILEQVAEEKEPAIETAERFPDWFIDATRPGIDLDEAIEDNRTPHQGIDL